jgi:hypothetical protein
MRLLWKAKPNGEQRASSDLAVTKAIFESTIRVGQASLQFYDGLLFTLYPSWSEGSEAPKVFLCLLFPFPQTP